jgi:hypothetical protein
MQPAARIAAYPSPAPTVSTMGIPAAAGMLIGSAAVKRASTAASGQCHGADLECFHQPRHDIACCGRAIKPELDIGEFRFVDFKQVRVFKRSSHRVGIDMGWPHIDVTKAHGTFSFSGKKILNLTATEICSL